MVLWPAESFAWQNWPAGGGGGRGKIFRPLDRRGGMDFIAPIGIGGRLLPLGTLVLSSRGADTSGPLEPCRRDTWRRRERPHCALDGPFCIQIPAQRIPSRPNPMGAPEAAARSPAQKWGRRPSGRSRASLIELWALLGGGGGGGSASLR